MSRISRPDSAQAYLLHHLPSYQRENRSEIIYAQDKASESHYVAQSNYTCQQQNIKSYNYKHKESPSKSSSSKSMSSSSSSSDPSLTGAAPFYDYAHKIH